MDNLIRNGKNNKRWSLTVKLFTGSIQLIIAFVFLNILSAESVSAFSGAGLGTQTNPYQISTCEQLQEMSQNLSAHYALAKNIDCSETAGWNNGAGFDPIGNNSAFYGSFNGQFYVISDLYINRPTENYVGLFGGVYSSSTITYGKISNVGLENISVRGKENVGGLAGYKKYGIISDCYTTGSVSGELLTGGLVGYSGRVTIANSYSSATVSGVNYTGGLVGWKYKGYIQTSYATGNVNGNDRVGGLMGDNYGLTVSSSYATGNVSGINYVGGLVGATNSGTILNSYSSGNVSGTSRVGGLMGYNGRGARIFSSYSIGRVNGVSEVGGLVGREYYSVIENSFYDRETSAQSDTVKGTPRTTAEMMRQTTFTDWDFTNIWSIDNGVDYPRLQWESKVSDGDNDGVEDELDNCPNTPNPDQSDMDGDGQGDVCDPDIDGDTVLNDVDNCAVIANQDQSDIDGDEIGDACDPDIDGDTVLNDVDNCVVIVNPDQSDMDGDEIGDVCDPDIDGDSVLNDVDNCAVAANQDQSDIDGDGQGDACDPDIDGDLWNNNEDCMPYDPLINPGAEEIPYNDTDENCNGLGDDTIEGVVDTIEEVISNIPVEDFSNPNNEKALSNKINSIIDTVNQAAAEQDPAIRERLLQSAMDKIDNDLIKKTDGCVKKGASEKNDWIETCYQQINVYEALQDLRVWLSAMLNN